MCKWKTIRLTGLLLLLIGSNAAADQFETAVAAYSAGDYDNAAAAFAPLASDGHAEAQLFLAEMYAAGQGVEADYERADSLMRQAANGGSGEAAYRMGGRLDRPFSDAEELRQALPWYELAATNNHKHATARLAELHHPETGALADTDTYLRWLTKAAEAQHAASMFELARVYNAGKLATADQGEVVRLVIGAAENGDADAQYHLSQMYMNGHGVAADGDEATQWLLWSARNKSPEGMHLLGILYLKGEGGATQDTERGLALLNESAALDLIAAQMTLSEVYALGLGVEKDLQTAMSWAYVAKEKGLPNPDETLAAVISRHEISASVQHYARGQAKRCLETYYKWCGSYYPY